jgi:TP901 family phage tail tape measure protein
VEALKGQVQALATQTATAPRELAQALFFVESAGFRGAQAMSVLEASARASAAGLGRTKDVADAVTSAVNAYGSETLSAQEAVDTLTATVREGKVQTDQLAGSLGKIIPIASQTGTSFQEVGASIAALTRVGSNAKRATTALRGVLNTLLKPSQKARDTLDRFGLSVAELRSRVREGNLIGVLQRLRSTFGDNEEALSKVFSNVRALTGVLGIVGNNADQVSQIMSNMQDNTGDANDAFQIMADTTGFQLRQAWIALKNVTIDWGRYVGSALVPVVRRLTAFLQNLSSTWKGLSSSTQTAIAATVGLTAAMGPVLWLIGSIIPGLSALGSALYAVAGAASTAWAALSGPLGLIIGGIAAVSASVYAVMSNWQELTTFFSDLFTGIGKMFRGFGRGVVKFLSFAMQNLEKLLIDAAVQTLTAVNSVLQSLGIDAFRDKINSAITSMTLASTSAAQDIQETKEQGRAAFDAMGEGASTFAGNVQDATAQALGSVMSLVTGAKDEVTSLFGGGSFGGGGAGGTFTLPSEGEGGGGSGGSGGQDTTGGSGASREGTIQQGANEATDALQQTRSMIDRVRQGFSLLEEDSSSFGLTMRSQVSALANDMLGLGDSLDRMAEKMKGAGDRMKAVWGAGVGAARRFSNSVSRQTSRLVGQFFEMESGINSVRDAMVRAGDIMKSALRSIVQQLVQAVVRALVLKVIFTAITGGGGSGSSLGMIGTGLGGGGLGAPAMAAEGGIVPAQPTSIIAGEGGEREAIMPLSKLDRMLSSAQSRGGGGGLAVQGAGGARLASGEVRIPVEVVNQANEEGVRRRKRKGRTRL